MYGVKTKSVYDAKSSVATEFINHEEILETLEYAKQNKNNKTKQIDAMD